MKKGALVLAGLGCLLLAVACGFWAVGAALFTGSCEHYAGYAADSEAALQVCRERLVVAKCTPVVVMGLAFAGWRFYRAAFRPRAP